MRIYGSNGAALATAPAGARRAAGGTFTLERAANARAAARPPPPARDLVGIDALMALQGVEDSKRAQASARSAKAAMRSTRSTRSSSGCWTASVDGNARPPEGRVAGPDRGDRRRRARLGPAEIELRVAVELAKAGAV